MVALKFEWIEAAQNAMRVTKVPASVSLAQFGLESGWGQHMPACSNNPFGIKAFRGPSVNSETTEVIKGKVVREKQPFAVFQSLGDAFLAHARLIASDARYGAAMTALPDLEKFVVLMAKHYATDPAYAEKILSIVHGDNLIQYDNGH